MFLKVSPTRGVVRFGMRGKLNSRYIGPFEVLNRVGDVAYRIALPPELSNINNTFHVSVLRRYVPDPSHIIEYAPLELKEDLTYKLTPLEILAREQKVLRNKVINLVKVSWRNLDEQEITWELEDQMREKYPYLF